MIASTLGPLAQCKPRELVKVKVKGATEWAIVGAPDPGVFHLIYLTGENAPFVINVMDNLDAFDPVAKYGTDYRFAHDPWGPCQIGNDNLSRTAGSLALTEDGEWYLLVKFGKNVRWLQLTNGKMMGERGSRRIAFGNWRLFIKELMHEPSETMLLSHATPNTSQCDESNDVR